MQNMVMVILLIYLLIKIQYLILWVLSNKCSTKKEEKNNHKLRTNSVQNKNKPTKNNFNNDNINEIEIIQKI
jgi:hypothetical protein